MKNEEWMDVERVEWLLKNKSYAELSDEEKEWIEQWVDSADDYEMLRKSEPKICKYFQDYEINPPDPKILSRLTDHVQAKSYKRQERLWWQFKPSFGIMLIAIIFGCLGWWIGQSKSSNNVPVAELSSSGFICDTIYIASQPDTVFTEKVIYRDRPAIFTTSSKSETGQQPSKQNSINMKEKEELEKLLVSGAE